MAATLSRKARRLRTADTPINRAAAGIRPHTIEPARRETDPPKAAPATRLPDPIDPAELATDLREAREVSIALHHAEEARRRLLLAIAADRTPLDMVWWAPDFYAAVVEAKHLLPLRFPDLPWERLYPQPDDEEIDGPVTYERGVPIPVEYVASEGLRVVRQRKRQRNQRPATQPGCPGHDGVACSGLRRPGERFCAACKHIIRAWARKG